MISAGHHWADIQSYTLPQIEAFLEAISRIDRDDMRTSIIAGRVAQADQKGFKEFMKGLR